MKKIIIIITLLIATPGVILSQCFYPAVNYNIEPQPRSITSGDFNGDGKIDLATANNLLTGNGTGGFTNTTISNLFSNNIESILTTDFNNDGKADLAMAGSGGLWLLLGNGTGGFSLPNTINLGDGDISSLKNIISGDFNNDGKKDLIAVAPKLIKILLGSGSGSFSVSTVSTLSATGNQAFVSSTAGDFNRDGRTDFIAIKCGLIAGYCFGYMSVFLGNGSGGFSSPSEIAIELGPRSITTDDLNNDGKLDVATSNASSVNIALGNGAGGFAINTFPNTPAYAFITSADFNGDGNKDLVFKAGTGAGNIIWLGDGTGGYATINNAGYYANSESSGIALVAADLNDDGKMDLATANYEPGSVSIILGKIAITTSQTNVSCFGGNNGTATATGTCGTNFSYSWNTSPVQTTATATGLSAGTYTVTVAQGRAVNTATVTITQPQDIVVNITTTPESCNGGGNNGTATASVVGGTPPYSFSWNTNPVQTNNTATNLSAGTYTLTVTDANGCTKSKNIEVIKEYNPSQFTYTINGMMVSFKLTGIGCNSFLWDFGNGNTSSINPNPIVTYASPATYGVCLQCNGQPFTCVKCINIKVPATAVTYSFLGNGNWNDQANWAEGVVPPSTLPSGCVIVISPLPGGQCILNVPLIIERGALLDIQPGASFIAQSNLTFL